MADSESLSSLVVVVLDTNPAWWGRMNKNQEKQLTLSKCLDSLMVFANSHLMMHHMNKLAIISAHSNASFFLYPKRSSNENVQAVNGDESHDGKYELFERMNEDVKTEIKDLVLNSVEVEFENDSLIAGALSMSLCYIHRMEKECPVGIKLSARVLLTSCTSYLKVAKLPVIKAADDNPAQYMNFMNSVFTAQKQNVVIDACILESDSGLLQQACDITGGMYLKIPQPAGLLQYLLLFIVRVVFEPHEIIYPVFNTVTRDLDNNDWVYLPDPVSREKLNLPPRVQVDYRAACFCHRNLIDIGYVCSVCLSIFCNFSPICSTCQTTFKIMAPPKLAKKKSKKAAG